MWKPQEAKETELMSYFTVLNLLFPTDFEAAYKNMYNIVP